MPKIRWYHHLMLFVMSLTMAACASRPQLVVQYELPQAPARLDGQTVRIQIKDRRTEQQVFTPAASRLFKDFEGRYQLMLVNNGKETPAGQNDLQGLFLHAFKKRLTVLGAEVLPDERCQAPLFQILLQEMRIDLRGGKWIVDIRYEASLVQDDQIVAREKVSGSAERTRIIGRKGAEEALSAIFSDIINRLDIVNLFQQAELVGNA